MSDAVFLSAKIKHTVGDLRIEAEFALREPWTVLFGPSGAGKSTILRILSGLLKAHSSKVVFHSIAQPGGKSARLGFVMQQPALFPHLTVARNISFGLHPLDQRAREQRLGQMLDLFGLHDLASRLPGRLSGGEQQRVALARALAPAPRLLLLDEPFAALDAELKERLLTTLVKALALEGTAAFYVSHDVAEAFRLQAEVLLLGSGKVVAQGPASTVLAEHRERLLRQLQGQ